MKKQYKDLYRTIQKPQILEIPKTPIISIKGQGDPNDNPLFEAHIGALYQLSYGFRMSYRKEPIAGYYSYSVAPLEGYWSTSDNQVYNQDKSKLTYELFIVQPDFVTAEVFEQYRDQLQAKNPYISEVEFKYVCEGLVGQILHRGSFETEDQSIEVLSEHLAKNGYGIKPDTHHEIYMSDFRRVTADKYKTLIRYQIEKLDN